VGQPVSGLWVVEDGGSDLNPLKAWLKRDDVEAYQPSPKVWSPVTPPVRRQEAKAAMAARRKLYPFTRYRMRQV
jgi:hypothetical protein